MRHVLGSRDRVDDHPGAAGTGRTALEQEIGKNVRKEAEKARRRTGPRPAKNEATHCYGRKPGFRVWPDTVARFFKDEYMQGKPARNGVIAGRSRRRVLSYARYVPPV